MADVHKKDRALFELIDAVLAEYDESVARPAPPAPVIPWEPK